MLKILFIKKLKIIYSLINQVNNYFLALIKNSCRLLPSSHAFLYNIFEVSHSGDMLIIKLDPLIIFFRVEISDVVSAVEGYHASEDVRSVLEMLGAYL